MKPAPFNLDVIHRAYNDRRDRGGPLPPISALQVAEKLQAIREGRFPKLAGLIEQHPRLPELMLASQYWSRQPGGWEAFTRNFMLAHPEALGTEAMRKSRITTDGCYSLADSITIAAQFYRRKQSGFPAQSEIPPHDDEPLRSFANRLLQAGETELLRQAVRNAERAEPTLARRIPAWLTPAYFWERCVHRTMDALPGCLLALAGEQSDAHRYRPNLESRFIDDVAAPFPWFDDLLGHLLRYLDNNAQRERQSIAQTTITDLAFEEIEYAFTMKANVMIAAESRLSKTAVAEAAARMWPGKVRYLKVPPDGKQGALLRAYAEALHIPCRVSTDLALVREQVVTTLHQTGVVCLHDEAHHLLQTGRGRGSRPERLEWVRCVDMDRKCGSVLLATPQTFGHDFKQFVADLHYNVVQVIGRVERPLLLPVSQTQQDILSVARQKFPQIPLALLEEVAAEAGDSRAAYQVLTDLCNRALFLAAKAGRETPTVADVRAAVNLWSSRPELSRIAERPAASRGQTKDAGPPPVGQAATDGRRCTAAPLQPVGRARAISPQSPPATDSAAFPVRGRAGSLVEA